MPRDRGDGRRGNRSSTAVGYSQRRGGAQSRGTAFDEETSSDSGGTLPLARRDFMVATGSGLAGAGSIGAMAGRARAAGDEEWTVHIGGEVYASPTVVDGSVYVGTSDDVFYALDADSGSERWTFEPGASIWSSAAVTDDTVYVGTSAGDNRLYALAAEDGEEQWSFETGSQIMSSPTVRHGRVYVGSDDERVYALRTDDGEEVWSYDTGDRVRSSPAVTKTTVYIGNQNGTVFAIDDRDGETRWTFDAGGRVTSSPTVVDGVVYVGTTGGDLYAIDADDGDELWSFETLYPIHSAPAVHESTVYFGNQHEMVYAVDTDNGDELWSFETDDWVRSSPTVVGETVFIGSYDGAMYALDTDDGSERFSYETGDAVHSSPVVVDGTVYFGSDDGVVYAVEAGVDGSSEDSRVRNGILSHHDAWAESAADPVVWSVETDDQVTASPTVVDDTVFIGSEDATLYALDSADGTERWAEETGISIWSSAAVVDGVVYVGSVDNHLYAFDADDGEELWTFETGSQILSSPTVDDNAVYIGSDDGTVYSLTADDGDERWSFETDDWIRSSPTVVDDVVLIGGEDNVLYALDVDDGEEKWRYETGHWIRSSATVVDGVVYFGSQDNKLEAVDLETGEEVWSFQVGNEIRSVPTVADGTIYFGSQDTKVYAVDAEDGEEVWSFETNDWIRSSATVVEDTVFIGSNDGTIYTLSVEDGSLLDTYHTGDAVYSSPTVHDGTLYVGSRDDRVLAIDVDVDGSSEDSRVELGTLGHHEVWANEASTEQVHWTFEVDNDFVEASPTVVDGVVYFGDGEFGEDNGTMYAVDTTTQSVLWKNDEPAQIRSDPQVVAGTVYVGDTDGIVHAFDADSGDHLWEFETDDTNWSSPTRWGDTVFVGMDDGYVYALDAETGDERWSYEIEYPVRTSPTVVDGVVYIGDTPGETNIEGWFHAIDATTGDVIWDFRDTELWIHSSSTVADGMVFFGCDDSTLYALDASDGSVEWTFEEPVAHVISATTYHDGVVYVGTDDTTFGVSDDATPAVVYAVDAESGEQHWAYEVPVPDDGDNWSFHGAPTVVGETLYIGNRNGTVYALDTESGEERWTVDIGEPVWSSPTVVDGQVYVGSDDARLHVLDAEEDGESEDTRVELGTLGHHEAWSEFGAVEGLSSFEATPEDGRLTEDETGVLVLELTDATTRSGDPFEGTVDLVVEQPDAADITREDVDFEDGSATINGPDRLVLGQQGPGTYTLAVRREDQPVIETTYEVEVVAGGIGGFAIEPVDPVVTTDDSGILELELVEVVDRIGDPFEGEADLMVEQPDASDIPRDEVSFVSGSATINGPDRFVLSQLDPGTHELTVELADDSDISASYEFDVVRAGLADFTVTPEDELVTTDDEGILSLELSQAVTGTGEAFDGEVDLVIEQPDAADITREGVAFEDGSAEINGPDRFVLSNQDLGTITLSVTRADDSAVVGTYEVTVVRDGLAAFDIEADDPIVTTDDSGILGLELTNATDGLGEPFDGSVDLVVEQPSAADLTREDVDFEDGSATINGPDRFVLSNQGIGTYTLSVARADDADVSETYEVEVVSDAIASFEVEPVDDVVTTDDQGIVSLEITNAVRETGEPFDGVTDLIVEQPDAADLTREDVDFEDGSATINGPDRFVLSQLEPGTHQLSVALSEDPDVSASYEVTVVAGGLSAFAVDPIDPTIAPDDSGILELNLVDAVTPEDDPFDGTVDLVIEQPDAADLTREDVDFEDGSSTINGPDRFVLSQLDPGQHTLEVHRADEESVAASYTITVEGETPTEPGDVSDTVPGPGVVGTVGSLVGAGYVLRWLADKTGTEDER